MAYKSIPTFPKGVFMKKVPEIFMVSLIFWRPGAWANHYDPYEDLYCNGSPTNSNITDTPILGDL